MRDIATTSAGTVTPTTVTPRRNKAVKTAASTAAEKNPPAARGRKRKTLRSAEEISANARPAKKVRMVESAVAKKNGLSPLEIPGHPSLMDVPFDTLMRHVFAKLDLQGLRGVALSCKALADLIWLNESFWKAYLTEQACSFFLEDAASKGEAPLPYAKRRLIKHKLGLIARFNAVCSVVKVRTPNGDTGDQDERMRRRLAQLSSLNWNSFVFALYDTQNDPPVTDKEDKHGLFRQSFCWETRTPAVKTHEERLLTQWRSKYPINTVALFIYLYPDGKEFASGTLLHNTGITRVSDAFLEAEDRYLRTPERWADPDDPSLDIWDKEMVQNSFLVQPFRWSTIAGSYLDLAHKEHVAPIPTAWTPLPADIRKKMTLEVLQTSPNVHFLAPHEDYYGAGVMYKAEVKIGHLVGTAYFLFEKGKGLQSLRWQFATTSFDSRENFDIFIEQASIIEKMLITAKGKPKSRVAGDLKLEAESLVRHFKELNKGWDQYGSLKHFATDEVTTLTFAGGLKFLVYVAPAFQALELTVGIKFF